MSITRYVQREYLIYSSYCVVTFYFTISTDKVNKRFCSNKYKELTKIRIMYVLLNVHNVFNIQTPKQKSHKS